MKPTSFPEQNVVFAKNQPEYLPLPGHVDSAPDMRATFCWQLTWRERLTVLLTGQVWQQVRTFGRPLLPQLLRVDKPSI